MKLDERIATRLGVAFLTREALESWRMASLREVVRYAKERAPFYRRRFSGLQTDALKSIKELPFTDVSDIASDPEAFVCVPQADVARVATFRTSGTSGAVRRFFSTDADLENTVNFFAHGMEHIPGTRTLICMSGDAPGSVGTLLTEALRRIGRAGFVVGPVVDPEKTLKDIRTLKADSLVGVPAQMLALARSPGAAGVSLEGLLLSGDYASEGLVRALSEAFGCAVFRHFGMAETGYGAAVECGRHQGLHIREADLWFEVVSVPGTGKAKKDGKNDGKNDGSEEVPDGEWGELVVTTLERRGMPLIRYRTGDLGRLLPGFCVCGSVLKRLEVRGRIGSILKLPTGSVHLSALNDVLDPIPWLAGFDAESGVAAKNNEGERGRAEVFRLVAYLACPEFSFSSERRGQIKKALETIPPFRDALSNSLLRLECERSENAFPSGAKRTIGALLRSPPDGVQAG